MKKVLESSMKIRFHDCDPYNHLNNARYIDYIMTARGDQLIENYGLDIYSMALKQKLAWVSAQTQIAYAAPAYIMEEVCIQTRLIHFSEKSLLVEGLMWNSDKTEMKTIMWAKLVHFNLVTQASASHTGSLMQLFASVVDPVTETFRFEERVQSLRQMLS